MEINSKAVSSLTQAKVVWAHSMWQKTPRHSAFCRAITIRAVHPHSNRLLWSIKYLLKESFTIQILLQDFKTVKTFRKYTVSVKN